MFDNKYLAITIGGLEIDLSRSSTPKTSQLLAAIRASNGQGVRLDSSLLRKISPAIADIAPDSLSLTVKEIVAARTRKANVLVAGFEIGLSLKDLPLIGQMLPEDANIDFNDLKVLFSTADLDEVAMKALQQIVPPGIGPLPTTIRKGLNFSAVLKVGNKSYNLNSSELSQLKSPKSKKSSASSSAKKRANVNKSYGPLRLFSLGLDYSDGVFSQVIGASLTLGPLTLGVEGLKIGSPLDHFSPRASLDGLSLALQTGSLTLGGGLRRSVVNGTEQYSGAVVMGMDRLQIEAYGAYTNAHGDPSLFVYTVINKPIGGPVFFFVTGLAAIFGFNRKLIPPSVTEVRNYPLIRAVMDKGNSAQLLADMEKVIVPMPGEYFFGVGVKFNSFKVINSFGLLIARFGKKVEFDFMGLSRYVAPDPLAPDPVAVIELQVAGRFDPEEGTILMRGQLTPESFIFSRDCHLQGGFAIACWTQGKHAGDFVYSYGGYGTRYQPPAHYPQNIPALGFSWPISNNLNVKGGGYYTITPKGIVAGLYLRAAFHIGWAYANFDLDAHFEFSWKPLHYKGIFHVEFSVGVHVEFLWWSAWLGFSIGADMEVHGPPFGGRASLHLWVCSIDISFGAPALPKPLLNWQEFQESFLPESPEEGLLSIRLTSGLVKKVKDENGNEVEIVNPKELKLITESFVPCTRLVAPSGHGKEEESTFGIAPMGVLMDGDSSRHELTIAGGGTDQFDFTRIGKRNPAALWGKPGLEENLVYTVTGYEIAPAASPVSNQSVSVDRNELAWELEKREGAFGWSGLRTFDGKTAVPSSDWVTNENLLVRNQLMAAIGLPESPSVDGLKEMLKEINIDVYRGTLNNES